MKKEVRIVVLGDENVGKSSLISVLVEEKFIDDVPHVMSEVSIPPEITPDNIPTFIVDTSARTENRDALETEIHRANVIILVYAVNDSRSFARLRSYWLPYIKSLGVNMPIVLVGNKIDTRGLNMTNANLEDDMIPLMDEYKEVETCVECSAKGMMNVSEIFYFALKSVLHPTAPLYNPKEEQLKPHCAEALGRIFKLCDKNNDGILDDEELNEFQAFCFGTSLQHEELESIKEIIKGHDPDGANAYGLTEPGRPTSARHARARQQLICGAGLLWLGFRTLHLLFIQRGRLESTWAVLRRFGYGDDLCLREDYLYPKYDSQVYAFALYALRISRIELLPDASVELTPRGFHFFAELFKKYDKDKDGTLCWAELEDLFSTSPGNPWLETNFPNGTMANERASVTLHGFLAQWSMTTLLDYRTTLAYLAYLGFPEDSLRAIRVTRSRRLDRKKGRVSRNAFLCYVIGSSGSGKTSILRNFVDKPLLQSYESESQISAAVNVVEAGHTVKHLVLQEISPDTVKSTLSHKDKLERCDAICLVYDANDANSFAYLANLCRELKLDTLPVLMVAAKSDLEPVAQRYPVQPLEFCRQRHWKPPVHVSVAKHAMNDMYYRLVEIAMNPNLSVTVPVRSTMRSWMITASVAGSIMVGAFIVYKMVRHHKTST